MCYPWGYYGKKRILYLCIQAGFNYSLKTKLFSPSEAPFLNRWDYIHLALAAELTRELSRHSEDEGQ